MVKPVLFGRYFRHLAAGVAAVGSFGCGGPVRRALPSPFPLVYGGVPVPAEGVGGSIEFGDGFRGQEQIRTEAVAAGLVVGIRDLIAVSLNTYSETQSNGLGGTFARLKIGVGRPFGPRSSLGVHLATAWTEEQADTVQDERLRSYDAAVPAEFLLWSNPRGPGKFSAYIGPRVVLERYTDRLNAAGSLNFSHWGILGGAHANVGILDLFAEANLAHVPVTRYRGQSYGGYWTVIPTVGLTLHAGRSHRWGSETPQ